MERPDAKPDDRSDNVEKLQNMIEHTMENMREAEDYMKANEGEMPSEEVADIREKNRRRRDAIEGFREEIRDEISDRES
jgi:small acid-soluble spore protein (thioredoxin-like protein)